MRRRERHEREAGPATARPRAGIRAVATALVLATIMAAVVALGATAARAAGPGEVPDTGRSVIEVGDAAVVRPGSVVDHVYVIGADAVIGGIVLRDVVCIGGDVLLLPTSVVQENVVCIGGTVVRQTDSVVLGDTTVVSPGSLRTIAGWNPISPAVNPLSGSALLGWAVSALAHIALAAAVAAAAPRPVAATTARIREHPWSSFGLGLLSALVVVPLVSVVLFVSVVGLPLLVPWLLAAVPIALIIAFVAVSSATGGLALRLVRLPTTNLTSRAATGALLLSLARLVPYAGAGVWLVAWTIGFGAVSVALWLWVRERRVRRRSPAAATTNPT